jgi:hypothetical protein
VSGKHPLHAAVWMLAPEAPRRFGAVPLEIVDELADAV